MRRVALMKKILFAFLLACLPLSLPGATLILADEDFDNAPESGNGLNAGNGNVSLTATAGDPTDSGRGNVGSADISPGGRWGEVRTQTEDIAIPVESVPGTDTFTVTLDVYIPGDTTYAATDRLGIILRWNGSNTNNNQIFRPWDSFTADTWETITLNGTLPQNGGDGAPLASVLPIISFDDNPSDAAAGVAAHIDNFRLEVSTADDDPNLAVPVALNFGEVIEGEGEGTRILQLRNSGANNTLTISGATLSGADSASFSFPAGTFPLDISPGSAEEIAFTFSPSGGSRAYSANLELASNDQNDPTLDIPLSGTVLPPFNGEELIINGDFELGSLVGWRDDARFNYVTDPTRSGTGAAEFNLAGGAQWGEARLDTTSPPALADDPQALAINEEMIGKEYEYSAWYYRPSENGMAPDDTVRLLLRWNKNNTNSTGIDIRTVGDIPVNTWTEVTGRGIIPEVGGDGLPTTSVVPLWSFQDVGSNATGSEVIYIDDVSLKIEAPPAPPRVVITDISQDGENITISWESETGMSYRIRSELDLAASEPSTWLTFGALEDIAATPPVNTATFPLPPEGERYFVVEQYLPPPVRLYFDDFETGAGDWVADNTNPGREPATLWEIGSPDPSVPGGPAASFSGSNCFGTNLAALTGLEVLVSLTSPVIDLTGQTAATLNFAQFRDIEPGFDFGRIRILDADNGDALIENLEEVIDDRSDWETYSKDLPPSALGKNIKFQFYYETDDFVGVLFPGWYIDDFEVTVPSQ